MEIENKLLTLQKQSKINTTNPRKHTRDYSGL